MSEVIVKLTSDRIKIKGGEYVQDLVRCKECKYWEGEERQGFYYFEVCSRTQLDALYDDFCSYGEREGE